MSKERSGAAATPDGTTASTDDLGIVASDLVALFEARAKDGSGRIRVEDLLSAASAVCGEVCLAASGILDPDHHAYTPGSVVMSDQVNSILSNDTTDWNGAGGSVFGLIRAGAIAAGYTAEDFPRLADVYRGFAAGVAGTGTDAQGWGFVPLNVSTDNRPRVQPLRDAYELRPAVRALFAEHRLEPTRWPTACAIALGSELARVGGAIDHGITVRLVLETVNGMAKTAPMTDDALRKAGS